MDIPIKKSKGKTIVVLLIIVILVLGSVATFFMLKNKGEHKEPIKTKTIFVETRDIDDGKRLSSNFIIVINNSVIADGTTNTEGLEEVVIPDVVNQNVYMLAYDSGHYVQMGAILNSPFSLDLYKKGELKITNLSRSENKIDISIKAENGQYRQLGFCVGWTYSFLDVNNKDYLQGEHLNTQEKCENYNFEWIKVNDTHSECASEFANVFPARLKNKVDKCYYARHTLDINGNMTIILNYETIQELGSSDEINIVFFDSDRNYLNKYTVEGANLEDIGALDYEYILTSECLKGGVCNLEVCGENCP